MTTAAAIKVRDKKQQRADEKDMPRSTRFARMPLLVEEVAATYPTACGLVILARQFIDGLPVQKCTAAYARLAPVQVKTFPTPLSHSALIHFPEMCALTDTVSTLILRQGKENNITSGKGDRPKAKKRRAR